MLHLQDSKIWKIFHTSQYLENSLEIYKISSDSNHGALKGFFCLFVFLTSLCAPGSLATSCSAVHACMYACVCVHVCVFVCVCVSVP